VRDFAWRLRAFVVKGIPLASASSVFPAQIILAFSALLALLAYANSDFVAGCPSLRRAGMKTLPPSGKSSTGHSALSDERESLGKK
jgi:hypothetical protein